MSTKPEDWATAARARWAAATPGEWTPGRDNVQLLLAGMWVENVAENVESWDAEAIAHSPEDMRRALACVEAADRLAALAEGAKNYLHNAPCHCADGYECSACELKSGFDEALAAYMAARRG